MPYKINREDLAWAGGFFDGEGCVSHQYINRTNKDGSKYRNPKIHVSQSGDTELLEKFKSIVGVGTIREQKSKHLTAKLTRFDYQAGGFENVQFVVGILWNFIGTQKKNQAKKVLQRYLNHMRRK